MLLPPPIPQLPLPLPLPMPHCCRYRCQCRACYCPSRACCCPNCCRFHCPNRVGCWPSRVGFRHQSPAIELHRRCRRVDCQASRADCPRQATGSRRRCRAGSIAGPTRPAIAAAAVRVVTAAGPGPIAADRAWKRSGSVSTDRPSPGRLPPPSAAVHRVRADYRQPPVDSASRVRSITAAGPGDCRPDRADCRRRGRSPPPPARADCRRLAQEAGRSIATAARVDCRRCRREVLRAGSCSPCWAGSGACSAGSCFPCWAGSWAWTAAPWQAGSGAWRVWSCRRLPGVTCRRPLDAPCRRRRWSCRRPCRAGHGPAPWHSRE